MISALVPLRDAGGYRTRIWEVVRARLELEAPDVEIVVAEDDGVDPFNKCMAINTAARQASGDVLYILDSDTYVAAPYVYEAARLLADGGWTRPWHRKVKLSERQTLKILEQPTWDGTYDRKLRPDRINSYWAAPPLLITREMFDEAGGMDERYRGYGGEDNAFAMTLRRLGYGLCKRVPGEALHLWHPRRGDYGADRWDGQDEMWVNSHLDREYAKVRTAEEMRELIAHRSEVKA